MVPQERARAGLDSILLDEHEGIVRVGHELQPEPESDDGVLGGRMQDVGFEELLGVDHRVVRLVSPQVLVLLAGLLIASSLIPEVWVSK